MSDSEDTIINYEYCLTRAHILEDAYKISELNPRECFEKKLIIINMVYQMLMVYEA